MTMYQPNGPTDLAELGLDASVSPVMRHICRIVTVKPYEERCPAELALETEGIEHETVTIKESSSYTDDAAYRYVDRLAREWDKGDGFINLEHDVAPWPGALEELWTCKHSLCRFRYPVFPPPRLTNGMGCMKFGKEVLATVSADSWMDLAWWDLDGQIISACKGAGHAIHEHSPHVAHVRRSNGMRPSELQLPNNRPRS